MLLLIKKLFLTYFLDIELMGLTDNKYYFKLTVVLFIKIFLILVILSYLLSFLHSNHDKNVFFTNKKTYNEIANFLKNTMITLNLLYYLRWHFRHFQYPCPGELNTQCLLLGSDNSQTLENLFYTALEERPSFNFVYEWHLNNSSFVTYAVQDYTNIIMKKNVILTFGLDPVSESLLMLVSVIFGLVFLYVSTNRKDYFFYLANLILIELGLFLAFFTRDLLIFFIAFEFTVLPMFYLIGKIGLQPNKIRADYYFIGYTLFGSVFLLYGILLLYIWVPELFFSGYYPKSIIVKLINEKMTLYQQYVVFSCLFIGFATKIPLFPFYNWLPEAHVEAPTEGSVILAALLLKLGGYGMYRYLFDSFINVMIQGSPTLAFLCAVSYLNASFLAFNQRDMKRIIAYSSIAHMSMALFGLFTINIIGVQGFLVGSVSHGFISAGLFFCVGCLYRHFGVRDVRYYGGIDLIFKNFGFVFLFFNVANAGFPFLSSFISEFLVFISLWESYPLLCFILGVGYIITIGYTYYLYNSVCSGNLNEFKLMVKLFQKELTDEEKCIFIFLIMGVIIFGIYPDYLLFI